MLHKCTKELDFRSTCQYKCVSGKENRKTVMHHSSCVDSRRDPILGHLPMEKLELFSSSRHLLFGPHTCQLTATFSTMATLQLSNTTPSPLNIAHVHNHAYTLKTCTHCNMGWCLHVHANSCVLRKQKGTSFHAESRGKIFKGNIRKSRKSVRVYNIILFIILYTHEM